MNWQQPQQYSDVSREAHDLMVRLEEQARLDSLGNNYVEPPDPPLSERERAVILAGIAEYRRRKVAAAQS